MTHIQDSTVCATLTAAPVGADDFLDALSRVEERHAQIARGNYETRREVCDWFCGPLATWAHDAFGPEIFDRAARGYADYCRHVARARIEYEETGRSACVDLSRFDEAVYENEEVMTPFMWARLLTYFWWPDMTAHLALYRDAFLDRLPAQPRLLELACGHGALGLTALEHRPDAALKAYDISPPAIRIANRLAAASPHAGRARFVVRDFRGLDLAERRHDGVVAAMLAEHLEDPRELFAAVARYLSPDGLAFVSTALESPQRDCAYVFKHESEPLLMAEEAGLRVRRLVCDGAPVRKGARIMPRGLAMVLAHR